MFCTCLAPLSSRGRSDFAHSGLRPQFDPRTPGHFQNPNLLLLFLRYCLLYVKCYFKCWGRYKLIRLDIVPVPHGTHSPNWKENRRIEEQRSYVTCPRSHSKLCFLLLFVIGSRNWRAARDMQRYRHEYPDYKDEGESDMVNLRFYKNEIPFQPNGLHINEILKNWKNDYDILEDNHSYIQWLFPLREQGVNWYAKPLTAREIQEFKSSDEVMKRFVQAYELMLGFYGIELVDPELGVVKRANNYPKRFQNLNWHSHNNLRITRILKCLGEMGYEHYQAPLVKFFLEETLVKHRLQNVKQSALDYFVFTVKNKHLRRELVYYAWKNFKPPNKFVWGPLQKLQKFQPQLSIFQSSVDGEGSVDSQNEGPVENQAKTCRMKEIESSGVGLQKDSKERSSLLAASKGSSQRDHQEEELDAPHPEKEKDESGEAQGREGKRIKSKGSETYIRTIQNVALFASECLK
uniref:Opioid growth factor receptor (OGFr) conserved domain-containing protein n=1 Tax=Ornithorhynchus anatinus TaxID=9258 RepID=F7DIG1_ORNAN